MARPKDKRPLIENEHFLSRCAKEEERLRLSLSTELKKDIDRLFEMGLHSDITLKSGFQEIHLHKFIVKTRSLAIYNRLHEVCTEAGGDVLVLPEWVDVAGLKDAIRLLYSTQTIQSVLNEDSDKDVGIVPDVIGLLTFQDKILDKKEKFEREEQPVPAEAGGVSTSLSDKEQNVDGNPSCVGNLEHQDVLIVGDHANAENHCDNVTGNGDELTCEHVLAGLTVDHPAGACSSVNENNSNMENNTLAVNESVDDMTNDDVECSEPDTENKTDHSKSENNGMILPYETEISHNPVDKMDSGFEENYSGKGDNTTSEEPTMPCDVRLSYTPCDSLGEALLRGYLKELDYDCVIVISGASFKAHKCVLAARCDYFSAMLGGAWMESDAQEINLEGITPPVMEQILLYLYGGVLDMKPSCPIGEVVMAADMYGIQGLNTILTYNLKKTYCHFFHKPCSGCETGVVETLTSAVTFNLTDLQDKCIDWINANKVKVWRTKTFACLPLAILDQCCDTAIKSLTIQCVMEVMLDCQKLNRNIPRLKWCEPILSAVTRLMDSAIEYTAKHFVSLLNSGKLRDIDKSLAYQMGLLEEIFDTVIKSLPVSGACQVYDRLSTLKEASTSEEMQSVWSEEFCAFIQSLFKMCEEFMKLHIHQMAHTKDWDLLNKDLQADLMKYSSFVEMDMSVKERKVGPRLARMQKKKPDVKEQKTLRARPVLTSDRTRKLVGSTGAHSEGDGKSKAADQGKSFSQARDKTGKTVTQNRSGKSTSTSGASSSHARATGSRTQRESSAKGDNSACSDGTNCGESPSKGGHHKSTTDKHYRGSQKGEEVKEDGGGACLPGQSFFFADDTEGQGSLTSLNAEGQGSVTSLNAGQGSQTSLSAEGQGSMTSLSSEGQGSLLSLNAEAQEGTSQNYVDIASQLLPDPLVFKAEIIPVFDVIFLDA